MMIHLIKEKFQHTAARRRLDSQQIQTVEFEAFQHTAARRRLADKLAANSVTSVSTHSRPKAADIALLRWCRLLLVSTHSRPKAAAWATPKAQIPSCFNTQPPEGGWSMAFLN